MQRQWSYLIITDNNDCVYTQRRKNVCFQLSLKCQLYECVLNITTAYHVLSEELIM